MANLAVSAFQFLGNQAVQIGTAYAQAVASQAITNVFDNRKFEGPRLDSFHLQTSRDGAPMARVFGRVRLAGQVIWASHIRETLETTRVGGGKGGGPRQTNYSYTINFAIGLCEGEILGVDRLWANGAPLQTHNLTMRVYTGNDDQKPDPVIEATEGEDVPGFRGTAYIVFEDFPLDGFGGRLPQINAEVVRAPELDQQGPQLEKLIKSVNLLPGSGEYVYSTNIVEETPKPGVSRPVNMNNLSGKSDLELSLDQLQAQLPNCKNISIISAWFGTDLRCANCDIKPGVERRNRVIPDNLWQVGRDDRGSAYLISTDSEGRPHYGGTPSDESLIEAISAIKSRGLEVTLYPFLLMDIPPDNVLPKPEGGVGQPAFPWRGRITSSVDQSIQTKIEVDEFFGTAQPSDFSVGAGPEHHRADDYKYRHFILYHANLARRAGGVDRFIIGTEMPGLTTLRDASNDFPAVRNFAELAADCRTILGPDVGITYAADWTEYFGYQPNDGSGDVYYHLDLLWAHPAISAIGIDAYFPLSDWRENLDHLDADIASGPHDPNYIRSQIEGGEGYDYFYLDEDARRQQTRSGITDGLAQKPWIYRYKDVRNWWQNLHFNRQAGVEFSTPTNWVPESKPVWFLEIGCPAIHNGAHQPNVFYDPKSSESKKPYFSDGYRDDLIQRVYLQSLISYWDDSQNNPISSIYGAPMIAPEMMSVWAWDARPYPDFPARNDIWSDGANWQYGHWINGRMGLVQASSIVSEIASAAGVKGINISRVSGLIQGYQIDRPMSARAALSPLFSAFGINLSDRYGALDFSSKNTANIIQLNTNDFVENNNHTLQVLMQDPENKKKDIRLHFIDISNDYQLGSVSATDSLAATVNVEDIRVPIVMDRPQAKFLSQQRLGEDHLAMRQLEFNLPTKFETTLKVGDFVAIATEKTWQITQIDSGEILSVSAVQTNLSHAVPVAGPVFDQIKNPVWVSTPALLGFDLPGPYKGPVAGSIMSPFLSHDINIAGEIGRVTAPIWIGALLSDVKSGPIGRWDKSGSFDFYMPDAALSGLPKIDVLNGQNKFALETSNGWEILQCTDLTLIAPDTYRASKLLRGLYGSDADMDECVPAGARILFLDQGLTDVDLANDWIGSDIDINAQIYDRAAKTFVLNYSGKHLRPLSPVHLKHAADPNTIRLNWKRRGRVNSDSWAGSDIELGETEELYRVRHIDASGSQEDRFVNHPEIVLPADIKGSVKIAQFSNIYGWGAEAEIIIP